MMETPKVEVRIWFPGGEAVRLRGELDDLSIKHEVPIEGFNTLRVASLNFRLAGWKMHRGRPR